MASGRPLKLAWPEIIKSNARHILDLPREGQSSTEQVLAELY